MFDAHFHYPECAASGCADLAPGDVSGCSCAHSEHGWDIQKNFARLNPDLVLSFGVHPQNPVRDSLEFLESLLERGQADAVGEAGFDLFTDEFRRNEAAQAEVWNVQLELAEKYSKPLVVHCRRANFRLFADSARLSRLPSVVFHSFMGSPVEALSLRRRGVDAYFSFGKQLLNGNRNAAACVRTLPASVRDGRSFPDAEGRVRDGHVGDRACLPRRLGFEGKEREIRRIRLRGGGRLQKGICQAGRLTK